MIGHGHDDGVVAIVNIGMARRRQSAGRGNIEIGGAAITPIDHHMPARLARPAIGKGAEIEGVCRALAGGLILWRRNDYAAGVGPCRLEARRAGLDIIAVGEPRHHGGLANNGIARVGRSVEVAGIRRAICAAPPIAGGVDRCGRIILQPDATAIDGI